MRTRTVLVFLFVFSVWTIDCTEPSDRQDTTIPKTKATNSAPDANNNGTATVEKVDPSAAPSTEKPPMVIEGGNAPPKKGDLKKEVAMEPKKKLAEQDEKPDEAYPQKVKPRKGVNFSETVTPIVPESNNCSNSNDTSDKCQNATVTTTLPPLTTSEITPTSTMRPKHHKPNVTDDVPDLQTPAKREDYVIPVVGIIFVIPLIVILGALVYKKGVDLWERRHYRPMDFLIDGIYNNQ
ncbi:uncharacterized protein LOC135937199 isoform X2 [Cloeon dipterum]|uniref:uncharacterized protein LOC135937199 isoform X2 n=1 Tax=Cloeon dipterum TaxID=197152 RepID=UPI0032209886